MESSERLKEPDAPNAGDASVGDTEALYPPLALGAARIWPPVVLAPMAGVTNYPYRKICNSFGAGLCVSEMVSSRGILEGSEKTWHLAHFGSEESPRSIQIFGCDPVAMGEAARRIRCELDVDHIDLNFGCPVPKVTRKGMGAAAPLDLDNFARVVREVVREADPLPVTLKTRLGMDDDRHTYLEAGRVAEAEGCSWIALHARTAKQMYSGVARWELIRRLKETVNIPVLGNGDIFTAPDALQMMDETGCDGVVIGRGCLGNPWLFRNLQRLFRGAGVPQRPSIEEVADVMRWHFELLCEHFQTNPKQASFHMRKFGTWYVRGIEGSAEIRRDSQKIASRQDLELILERLLEAHYMPNACDPARPTRPTRQPDASAEATTQTRSGVTA